MSGLTVGSGIFGNKEGSGGGSFKGLWNASTNTPTLADGIGTNNDYYIVSVAGSQDLGHGVVAYTVGDEVRYNGVIWVKIDRAGDFWERILGELRPKTDGDDIDSRTGSIFTNLINTKSGNLRLDSVGNIIEIGSQKAGIDNILRFMGETNQGDITWQEDEDNFDFSCSISLNAGQVIDTISTDTTWATALDTEVATKAAAKAYIATQIGGKDEFAELNDVTAPYSNIGALTAVNGSTDGMLESTTLLTQPAANQFSLTRGTSALAIQASATIDQDLSSISNVDFNDVTLAGTLKTDNILPNAGVDVNIGGSGTDGSIILPDAFDVDKIEIHAAADSKFNGGDVLFTDLRQTTLNENVADDGFIDLTTSNTGWGFIIAGDNEEYAHFSFSSAGVVILQLNSTNVVNTDTDTNLCIFDNGTNVRIRNRLGAAKDIKAVIHMG